MVTDARHVATIGDMPKFERPRERLKEAGARALSNSELIAILLRTGRKGENVLDLSGRVLREMDGLRGVGRVTYDELCGIHGISDAKACQVLAALELGNRLVSLHPEDRPRIDGAQDVANLLAAEMGRLDQEQLRVLLLSIKNEVMGSSLVYQGNVNSSVVRVAEILKPAVRGNHPSVIVVHNHPSGDPTPSPEDVLITNKIRAGAEMLDIELLDHVVIGGSGHVSMKERGLGFGRGVGRLARSAAEHGAVA
jgi:DNA repair protein RadC